jgi:hypothetical protein
MALAAIPEEINRHFEAVVVLSKRDVLLRLLHEAELCLQSQALSAATIIAAVVLEEASLLNPGALDEEQDNVKVWREMRNRAAHPSGTGTELKAEQVKRMVTGIRAMLRHADRPDAGSSSLPSIEDTLKITRGKYAFVETSVDEFLKRKHQELELEDQK